MSSLHGSACSFLGGWMCFDECWRDEVGVCGESHQWVPWKDRAERRRRTVSLWNFNRSLVGYLRNLCNNPCSNGSVFSDSGAENHKLECILTFILTGVKGRKDSHKHKKKVRSFYLLKLDYKDFLLGILESRNRRSSPWGTESHHLPHRDNFGCCPAAMTQAQMSGMMTTWSADKVFNLNTILHRIHRYTISLSAFLWSSPALRNGISAKEIATNQLCLECFVHIFCILDLLPEAVVASRDCSQ